MRRLGVLLGTVAVLCAAPVASALADSAVISAADIGDGQMRVTAEVTSTACAANGACSWFSYAYERHSSLPCAEDDAFIMGVQPIVEKAGTVKKEWNYEPFFPRLSKVCVFIYNAAGDHLVGETVVSLPEGYGRQYSTAHNCSYFANQRRAEYYLEFYPSDPSRLDADHDGQACESNPCPCGAEAIPPEPVPPPPILPPLPPTPTPAPVVSGTGVNPWLCLTEERNAVRAWAHVSRAKHQWQLLRGTHASRNLRRLWREAKERARRVEAKWHATCG